MKSHRSFYLSTLATLLFSLSAQARSLQLGDRVSCSVEVTRSDLIIPEVLQNSVVLKEKKQSGCPGGPGSTCSPTTTENSIDSSSFQGLMYILRIDPRGFGEDRDSVLTAYFRVEGTDCDGFLNCSVRKALTLQNGPAFDRPFSVNLDLSKPYKVFNEYTYDYDRIVGLPGDPKVLSAKLTCQVE